MNQITTLISFTVLILSTPLMAQYEFTEEINIENTTVKSQGRTGTCWSFSTTSFLEAEALRMGKGFVDFSEMYNVYHIYQDKADNYVSRQGKANFSQGSLAHDVFRTVEQHGIIPQSEFPALLNQDTMYNHSEMEAGLTGFLDGVIQNRKPTPYWRTAVLNILQAYMGTPNEQFQYKGKQYNPISFAKEMGIQATNYISLTSYTHQPFHSSFILNIPDNYSNQQFYNIPLSDFMQVVDHALEKGYTLAWDGDVSEKGFLRKEGIAVLPKDLKGEFKEQPSEEIEASQEIRQALFENYSTTDDHLMHIVGKATDQNGTAYYIIKNSWGKSSNFDGYLYMSETYFKLKTVSVTVHKKAVPRGIMK